MLLWKRTFSHGTIETLKDKPTLLGAVADGVKKVGDAVNIMALLDSRANRRPRFLAPEPGRQPLDGEVYLALQQKRRQVVFSTPIIPY